MSAPSLSRRFTRAFVAGLGAAVFAVAIAVPVAAVPAEFTGDCVAGFAVDNAEGWSQAVEAASECVAPSVVITITASFEYPESDLVPAYSGDADLTVVGAGDGVTVTGLGGLIGDIPAHEHLFLVSDAAGSLTIRNLHIERFTSYGAVVTISDSPLIVVDSTFSFNSSINAEFLTEEHIAGGAISAAGPVIVTGSEFIKNAGFFGGAIAAGTDTFLLGPEDVALSDASVTITDSTFTWNFGYLSGAVSALGDSDITASTFTNNLGLYAGAVFAFGPSEIADSSFVGNAGQLFAGAVALAGGGSVDSSAFTRNGYITEGEFPDDLFPDAEEFGDEEVMEELAYLTEFGGGLAVFGATTIDASTFSANRAVFGGAIFATGDGDFIFGGFGEAVEGNLLEINGTTFDGNLADSEGGAIATDADLAIFNSTFVNNVAEDAGGAIVAFESELVVVHTTLVDNIAPAGAHVLIAEPTATLTSVGSVYGDSEGAEGCLFEDSAVALGDFNFDVDGTCNDSETTFGLGEDPLLSPLGDWGGPTPTMLPMAGSPLIDAMPLDASVGLVDDQRGAARLLGSRFDIGSVETASSTFTIATDAGTIHGTVTDAIGVSDVTWLSAADGGAGAPAGIALPFGLSGFTIALPVAGATATITLELPSPALELWKVQGGVWSKVTTAEFSGTTVTYQATDGGALDEDGVVNAEIVDPVAPSIGASFTG